MGSGHFVVAMFERLVALRLAEEKLDEVTAVAAVIRENLFGLEIDPRCTQIGVFNLALAAWRRAGHRPLPTMNLACSGLAPNTREADWLAIAGDNEKLRNGIERLYRLLQKAAVLGSLINPRAEEGGLLVAAFNELQPLLEKALAQETQDDAAHEMAVTAHGLAKAAEILGGQFTLVATNVPYLGRGKQDEVIQDYCARVHPKARADLATCFVERCLQFCARGGSPALVTPQNWLFLGTYSALRRKLLETFEFNAVARLGPRGFQTPMFDFNIVLVCLSAARPASGHAFTGIDVGEENTPDDKAKNLIWKPVIAGNQNDQLRNPDSRLILGVADLGSPLGDYASSIEGLITGDMQRFLGKFWERPAILEKWEVFVQSVNDTCHYGGRSDVVFWEKDAGALRASPSAHNFPAEVMNGRAILGKHGIRVTQMPSFACTLYMGEVFSKNAATVVPHDLQHLPAIWSFVCSAEFRDKVRKIDQALKVTNATFTKVPFDLAHWQKVAAEKYPDGLPKPFSSDATQWLFNGHPARAYQPLHVAVARLVGYQWPRQTGSSFPDCPVIGPDELERLVDDDGIVCVPGVRGERPAHERVLQMLQAAWSDDWNEGIPAKVLADTGSSHLDDWLRNGFFEQHCRLFHHRPFIWHIWDGRKRDGFHALVNYHKLAEGDDNGRRLLESLSYSYLGDWINLQQDSVKRGEGGAEDRLAAALELQKRLVAILEGEPPFDFFIRWKPIEDQAIGWEPDINDGVRLNIRPFMARDLPGGKKGAGILRAKPNIHWKKDRGKEPVREQARYPWFWENGKFTGRRVNDVHFTLAEKRAAREAAFAGGGNSGSAK